MLYEENWDVGIIAMGCPATTTTSAEESNAVTDRHVSTRFEGTTPTTLLSLHRKEFNSLLGGLKEKILNSWVRERRNSVLVPSEPEEPEEPEEEENKQATTDKDKVVVELGVENLDVGLGVDLDVDAVPLDVSDAISETKTTATDEQPKRISSMEIAHKKLQQGVVLARLSVGSQSDLEKRSSSRVVAALEEDDDDMDDEEEDEEEGSGDDDDDEEYDSSGELDLEWDTTCTMLAPDIQFVDLEPRAQLGQGSFGSVQLVLHKPTQRHYALKLMSRSYITENGWEEMVEHERNAMLELAGSSKFLIDLYTTFCDQHYIYMLMELCTGGELYEHLCSQENKSIGIGAMRFCKWKILFFIFLLLFLLFA